MCSSALIPERIRPAIPATLGQRGWTSARPGLARSVALAPNRDVDRNHGSQRSLSGLVQLMYTPSAIGPRISYHGELVHRAEPKSYNLTNHALGTPRHFARRCINQPLHAVNLFYISARVGRCWEAEPRVSLRLPAAFGLRVVPQRLDRDVSSKSWRLNVLQSRYLRQIYLRYQYWTAKISITYGFIKCGEIRSTSAAKMTACGNSNAAVVNS